MVTRDRKISISLRSCGGWIGVFDDGSPRFTVTAESESEAESALQQSLARWQSVPVNASAGEHERHRI